MSESCVAIVAAIITADAPVLFFDTCALLDIIRAPIREKFSVQEGQAANHILSRMEATPIGILGVINEQVTIEFKDHIEAVEKETLAALKKASADMGSMLSKMWSLLNSTYPIAPDLTALGFPTASRNIIDRIIGRTLVIEDRQDEKAKAGDRVATGTPPSSRGKQSYKDCLVTETFLRAARELRNAGFVKPIIFLSSNIEDYCNNGRYLIKAIRDEFDPLNIVFAKNWVEARYSL